MKSYRYVLHERVYILESMVVYLLIFMGYFLGGFQLDLNVFVQYIAVIKSKYCNVQKKSFMVLKIIIISYTFQLNMDCKATIFSSRSEEVTTK